MRIQISAGTQRTQGGFLDIRSSARRVWTREGGATRWLLVRWRSNGEYAFIWRVRVLIDSRAGPGVDYVMKIAEWDQAPDSRCNVRPRPGRPGEYVEGTFPFSWIVDPTIHGVSCRVRSSSVHATKRIRWRLVSQTNLGASGGPTVVDHAPNGGALLPLGRTLSSRAPEHSRRGAKRLDRPTSPLAVDLAHVVPEVDQELGQPRGVVPASSRPISSARFSSDRSSTLRSSRATGSPRAATTRAPTSPEPIEIRSRTVQHEAPNLSPSGWKAFLIRLSARL